VERLAMRAAMLLGTLLLAANPAFAQEDEIVANLAGGRVIIQVARDTIIFAAIDHPVETKSVPPRVAEIDPHHVGIFFGASEWQVPAQPQPIRLDYDIVRFAPQNKSYERPGEAEFDLEQIGISFLEKLRPLVSQLHHKIDLKPDEPLLEIVLIGFGPKEYGPEIWVIEYHVEQESISSQADFWQTHILRPRFTQLYPPEKHAARTLLEVRVPTDLPGVPLQGLLQQNDPALARLRSSDPRFSKVVDQIERGEAQKANPEDAAGFLRAALPLIAGEARFILGTMGETANFQWIVPPAEPVEKQKTAEDKNRPPDAPTLRRKPNP
jgi:hypothetical protein